MAKLAIIVDKLSKRYQIGKSTNTSSLYKQIQRRFITPFRYQAKNLQEDSATGEFWALKDVSFEVKHGEVLGIIGRNGAGKSTLLKILSRITEPTSGRAILNGRVGSLLEVGTGFNPELTGRENIYLSGTILGMKKAEIDRRFDEILAFSEVEKFLDTPVKRYSSGMYVRLAFSVAAHLETEILLVDEVLAVGDAAFQQKCLGKMDDVAKGGKTILFVSHNLSAIKQMCSRTLVIQNGQLAFEGLSQAALDFYMKSFGKNESDKSTITHTLGLSFMNPQPNLEAKHEVTKVEILDKNGNLKNSIQTGDFACFRITWRSDQAVANGGVELGIHTMEKVPLIQYSTRPVTTVDVKFRTGINNIDCEFPSFALAAGRYLISVSLTRPKIEWLYHNDQFSTFTVGENDVFQSGTPVTTSRAYLVIPHQWRIE